MNSEWAAVLVALGSLFVSVLALVGAGLSVGYSRGQRDAAVRQANAAEAQTAFMGRQVELMEAEQTRGTGTASRAPSARVVPWSLAHWRGDTYSLTNGGTERVFDVRLEAPEHTVTRGPYRWEHVDPRAAVTFLLAFSMASVGRDVTVRWRWEPGGEEQTWTSSVPPKSR